MFRSTLAAVCLICLSSAAQAQSITVTQFDATTYGFKVYGTSGPDTCEMRYVVGNRVRCRLFFVDPVTGEDEQITEFLDLDDLPAVEETSLLVRFYGGPGDDEFYFDNPDEFVEEEVWLHCQLFGGQGIDSLSGGPFRDWISGGQDGEADLLSGGGGGDTFVEHLYHKQVYSMRLVEPGPLSRPTAPLKAPNLLKTTTIEAIEYEMLLDFTPDEGDHIYNLWDGDPYVG